MKYPNILQKINIKYFMVGYLALLLLYSSIYLEDYRLLVQGIFIVALYVIYDLIWTYLRDKVWYLPVSSVISGLVLSLIVFHNIPPILVILLPLIAVTSKQLLHFRKNRHIFNPASFALAIMAFIAPVISWWAPVTALTPSLSMLNFANSQIIFFGIFVLGGIIILWRQKRWHITIPFFVSYAFFLTIFSLLNGKALTNIPLIISNQLFNGVIIFFATVMLIEPMTSTFNGWWHEVVYGIIVGFAVVTMIYLTSRFNWTNQDPLVYGLLIGNLVASLMFLSSKPRAFSPNPIIS